MRKPIYLGIPILEISKIVMYDLMNIQKKQEYLEKTKLYYMDMDSFIVYIKTEDIYLNIEKYVEGRLRITKTVTQMKKLKSYWINER